MIILSLIIGLSIVLIPYFCLRIAFRSENRSEQIILLLIAVAVIFIDLVFVFENNFWVFLLGVLLATGIIFAIKQKNKPDFIVEGSLLEDSVSPEINMELEELALEVKKSDQEDFDKMAESGEFKDFTDLNKEIN